MSEILRQIKSPTSEVFRKVYIKRRVLDTGLFESDWVEITNDIKSFGKIKSEIDAARLYKFSFANAKIAVNNEGGRYNPHDDEASLWYGFLNQQRTLVKYEAGFLKTSTRDGAGIVTEYVQRDTRWDEALWDSDVNTWDLSATTSLYMGVISGDVLLSDQNQVTFNIKPLTSIFQDYPAKNLTGWTSTGMTASQFIAMLRDQTDGSGSFIFRPFFGDTTSNWDISTTSNVYSNLNTSTAKGVYGSTVWEVIEKLAESEDFVPFVSRSGVFRFVSRDANTTAVAYEFHGAGSVDSEYGQTIKGVKSYGKKFSKYYSAIRVKWRSEDTTTSYEIVEAPFSVASNSSPWVLGHKTLDIENLFIPTSTVANTIAQGIFDEYSTLKNEIEYNTSFIPHLDLFDRCSIQYDPSPFNPDSLWDQRNWASDNTVTSDDLIFDFSRGDAIKLTGQEFKFLSVEIDLDNFETRFVAREV